MKKKTMIIVAVLTVLAMFAAAFPEVIIAKADPTRATSTATIDTTQDIVYGSYKTAINTAKGFYSGTSFLLSDGMMQVGILNSAGSSMGYVNVAKDSTQERYTTMNLTGGNSYRVRLRGWYKAIGTGYAVIP